MNYRKIAGAGCLAFALTLPVFANADTQTIDIFPDTWVAIDGLERELPTAADQPFRNDKDRTVGIFYVSWHYDWFYTNFKAPLCQRCDKDSAAGSVGSF